MEIYVPQNYIKLYSPYNQGRQTLDVILQYTSRDMIITDGTAGIGGNAIFFSKFFKTVNCIEINPQAFLVLSKNLMKFRNITFYNNDFIKICKTIVQDIIFLDPPWEINYKSKVVSTLNLSDVDIKDVIENLYTNCKILVLKCPLNFECIVNNWIFTTHYIYNKNKKVIYKIMVFHK
jgi:16S rRNA G966 N2-methylase RsmD